MADMTTPKDPDICDCPCHTTAGIMHAIGCCITCPYCLKRIVRSRYMDHAARCPAKATSKATGNPRVDVLRAALDALRKL